MLSTHLVENDGFILSIQVSVKCCGVYYVISLQNCWENHKVVRLFEVTTAKWAKSMSTVVRDFGGVLV